jgi:hypothetical protein
MGISESRAAGDLPQGQTLGNQGIKDRLTFVVQGAVGGLIGTVCCILPAIAIVVGLTGGLAATLVSLGRFMPYTIIIGLAFVALASWLSVRRRRSCCNDEQYKRLKITVPLTMLLSFGAVYGLVMYLILPLLYRIG